MRVDPRWWLHISILFIIKHPTAMIARHALDLLDISVVAAVGSVESETPAPPIVAACSPSPEMNNSIHALDFQMIGIIFKDVFKYLIAILQAP